MSWIVVGRAVSFARYRHFACVDAGVVDASYLKRSPVRGGDAFPVVDGLRLHEFAREGSACSTEHRTLESAQKHADSLNEKRGRR